MSSTDIIRIGTRGSLLALAQAHEARGRLTTSLRRPEAAFEIHVIKTSGDTIQDRTLADIGGKGLFTKEIEEALLAGRIDVAIHSMKDMPTALPPGLVIGAILPRQDPRDVFISPRARKLAELPAGAVVATSSLRRAAQVLNRRPDLKVVPIRGNVDTRLRKLGEGLADATLLAAAGLKRLGLADRVTSYLSPEEMLPAVAQGAIGIEARANDHAMLGHLAAINDTPSEIAVKAERAFLARLEGSCRTPIAALALVADGGLVMLGELLSPDGRQRFAASNGCRNLADGEAMAREMADGLLRQAGPDFRLGGA